MVRKNICLYVDEWMNMFFYLFILVGVFGLLGRVLFLFWGVWGRGKVLFGRLGMLVKMNE